MARARHGMHDGRIELSAYWTDHRQAVTMKMGRNSHPLFEPLGRRCIPFPAPPFSMGWCRSNSFARKFARKRCSLPVARKVRSRSLWTPLTFSCDWLPVRRSRKAGARRRVGCRTGRITVRVQEPPLFWPVFRNQFVSPADETLILIFQKARHSTFR